MDAHTPILQAMLDETERALSVLYVCNQCEQATEPNMAIIRHLRETGHDQGYSEYFVDPKNRAERIKSPHQPSKEFIAFASSYYATFTGPTHD